MTMMKSKSEFISGLFLFSASTISELREKVKSLKDKIQNVSTDDLENLASDLIISLEDHPFRAALIATSREELISQLFKLDELCISYKSASKPKFFYNEVIWLNKKADSPVKIGFIFPGQGSQFVNMGRELVERFSWAQNLVDLADNELLRLGHSRISPFIYRSPNDPRGPKQAKTWRDQLSQGRIVQPSICLTSLIWGELFRRLGIHPSVLGGHSLGELTALHWAGAFDASTLLKIAALRGKAMQATGRKVGSMASLSCSYEQAEALIQKTKAYVTVANINAPGQTVVSGEKSGVNEVLEWATQSGIQSQRLSVSNAMHSKMVKKAADQILKCKFIPEISRSLKKPIFLGVPNQKIGVGFKLREYLSKQVLSQVDFINLVKNMKSHCDIFVEVGPGSVLTGLANSILNDQVAFPAESRIQESKSFRKLLAHLFIQGVDLNWNELYPQIEEVTPKGNRSKSKVVELIGAQSRKMVTTREEPHKVNVSDEAMICEIWRNILGLSPDRVIGSDENFFSIGGNSLLATQLAVKLSKIFVKPVVVAHVFENPTIRQLAKCIYLIQGSNKVPRIPKARHAKDKIPGVEYEAPLSFTQERMWILEQIDPGNVSYNIPLVLRIQGNLRVDLLAESIGKIVQRHHSLRTNFRISHSKPVQQILKYKKFEISTVELNHVDKMTADRELSALIDQEIKYHFDLKNEPLFRVKLVHLGNEAYVFMVVFHHMISDHVSVNIFFEELRSNYTGLTSGETHSLSPLTIQYPDFSCWQRKHLSGQYLQKLISHWRKVLNGIPSPMELPTDFPRPDIQSYRGKRIPLRVSRATSKSLKYIAQQADSTIFMTLMAAFQTLLARYKAGRRDQFDVVVGAPIANRNHQHLDSLIGFFANTLVYRTDFSDNPTFIDLIKKIKKNSVEAYSFQDLPTQLLVESLQPERNLSYSPIFQVLLIFQSHSYEYFKLPGLEVKPIDVHNGTSKFDLTLNLAEVNEELVGYIEYDTSLFREETIERMVGHFVNLLQSVTENPSNKVFDLDFLSQDERQKLLIGWNNTKEPFPVDKCVHHLFEEQSRRTPENIAIHAGEEKITYRSLEMKAEVLARRLKQESFQPNDLVGVYLDRSIDMFSAILGIMKAGAAYLPLDPKYPKDRLDFMIEDSGVKVIVTNRKLQEVLLSKARDTVLIEELPESIETQPHMETSPVTPEDLAYVIYTSGSTGKPKGVQICHRSVVNLLFSMKKSLEMSEQDGVLALASLSFDMAVPELYLAFTVGARIILADHECAVDPFKLANLLSRAEPTVMQATPITWKLLLKSGWTGNKSLKLISGAEPISSELVNQLLKCCHSMWNMYGPTETTVWSTISRISDPCGVVSIGRPVANTDIYILDPKYLSLLPIGVPGEIYIGGIGVSKGYLNRPELTSERFITDPFKGDPNKKIYKTGDIGRYLVDGNILCMGRNDHQVKIRGFRIELGEIESTLNAHASVESAAVIVQECPLGEKKLVAYVVSKNKRKAAEEIDELRDFLGGHLPEYMIPQHFTFLESFPKTPSGKVDRRVLVNLGHTQIQDQNRTIHESPKSKIEISCATIWSEVLHSKKVGLEDNFFSLGGDSLLALDLILKVRKIFKRDIPVSIIFENQTLSRFSVAIQRQLESSDDMEIPIQKLEIKTSKKDRHSPFPLTDLQEAYWVGQQEFYEIHTSPFRYFETEIEDLDVKIFELTLNKLIERHEMLRSHVSPNGQLVILKKAPKFGIQFKDLSSCTAPEIRSSIENLRAEMTSNGPVLEKWPLFEVRVCRVDKGKFRIHFKLSLLISDARSSSVFNRELLALYKNTQLLLKPVGLSFRDYSIALKEFERTDAFVKARDYWESRLPSLPPAPELPIVNGTLVKQNKHVRYSSKLSREDWAKFKLTANRFGLTPNAALCAAYAEILDFWSHSHKFTINVVLGSRRSEQSDMNKIFGNFSTTLLLEVDLADKSNFVAGAQKLQGQLWSDLNHLAFSGIKVIRELARVRGLTSVPFGPVVFSSMLGIDNSSSFFEDEFVHEYISTPQVWLNHDVYERKGFLEIVWYVREDIFPPGFLERMFNSYSNFLKELATDEGLWKGKRSRYIPKDQLIQQALINDTRCDVSKSRLEDLFRSQVKNRASSPAIIDSGMTITYENLAAYVNRLGSVLKNRGVTKENIAVVMDKGWEQVVAVLGIVSVEAVYVPIDSKLPKERLHFLLENSNAKLIVTQSWLDETLDWPENLERICIPPIEFKVDHDNFDVMIKSIDDLAYIIYTSGSTGHPKGVMIDHRGAVNTIVDINKRFSVSGEDRVLALSSLSFDLSVYDVFGILGVGGTVVFPEKHRTFDPASWFEIICKHNITIWNTVPALMQIFVEYLHQNSLELPSSFKLIMMSGDWIPIDLPQRIREISKNKKIQIISLGGATEASIWSIYYVIDRIDPTWKSIPYGKPLANQTFHVFNHRMELCPTWVTGDLYIGGIGLALGYWKNETLTSKSFVSHPDSGERLYKTGDLGRYLPDGNIEFLGRADFQVKLNGFRVELGEIEATLLTYPDIQGCVTKVFKNNHGLQVLVAYIKLSDSKRMVEANSLRKFLEAKLPSHMIPASFVLLENFPLNSNGKIDREKLTLPESEVQHKREVSLPRDKIELDLLNIWRDLLKSENINIDDNFFEVGGNSLQAIRLMTRIAKLTSAPLPLTVLFKHKTVRQMADLIRKSCVRSIGQDILIEIQKGEGKQPIFLIHPIGGNVFSYLELARALGEKQPVFAVQARGLEGVKHPHSKLKEMILDYVQVIRNKQPVGPYWIGGWSFGGVVALEIGRELKRTGNIVNQIFLIDSFLPDSSSEGRIDQREILQGFFQNLMYVNRCAENSLASLNQLLSEGPINFDKLFTQARSMGILPPDISNEKAAALFSVYEANALVLSNYSPNRYLGKVGLIRAEQGRMPSRFSKWIDYLEKGTKTHSIPGDHYSIMTTPNVSRIASIINEALASSWLVPATKTKKVA